MSNEAIATVLWDIKESDRPALQADFIIKRVLVYGGIFLVRDAIREYGESKIKEVFNSIKQSEIGEKRYHFFKECVFA